MGDLEYLKDYLASHGYKNLKNKQVRKVMPEQGDTLLEMLCLKGHVDMLKFVRGNNLVTDPATYANKAG